MIPPLRIGVVYHSVSGTTATLAEAVRRGASAITDVQTFSIPVQGRHIQAGRYENTDTIDRLSRADALIFGSPTFMGCVSAQFKAFADATSAHWAQQRWAGKFAAGFTIGTNLSGDQLNTIQYLNLFANQHGMLWVSLDIPGGIDSHGLNRLGAQSGLIAHEVDGRVHPADLATAEYLGRRVATLTRHMHRSALPPGGIGKPYVTGSRPRDLPG